VNTILKLTLIKVILSTKRAFRKLPADSSRETTKKLAPCKPIGPFYNKP